MSILVFQHSPLWYACATVHDVKRIKPAFCVKRSDDLQLNSADCHAFCTSTNTLYVYDMPFPPFFQGAVYYPAVKGGVRAVPAPAAYLDAFKRFVKLV